MINWLQKLTPLTLRHEIQTNKILKKKIEDFGKKVPHFIGLVEKTNYNKKIIERENQTANSSVLVSKLQ